MAASTNVCFDFNSIQVGDTRSIVREIGEEDVRRFVELTGDDNPLHVNRAFAASTCFKDVVVHGMLGASFLSTVIGTQLPGPGALWISQAMDFLYPVRLGDTLTVRCTVKSKHLKERLLDLETVIVNQDRKEVLRGSGRVKMLIAEADKAAPFAALSKVAIVIGGAGSIGSAICRRLAKDGFSVVINYRNESARAEQAALLIEEAGGRAIAVQADITTAAGATMLSKVAHQRYGKVGVLIHSASTRVSPQELAALEWDDLQDQLEVQLKGALLSIKECVPGMAEQGAGRIVLLTSQAIAGQPSLHWTAYASAKAALAMLSRSLAVELGASGITVNCVSPGMTESSLIGDIPEKMQLMTARQTPLRRLGRPEDVAGAVAYLVSEEAAFISGQTLAVDGGMVAGW